MNPRLHFHMSHFFHPFFQVDDGGGGAGGGGGKGDDSVGNFDQDMEALGGDAGSEDEDLDEEGEGDDEEGEKPRRAPRKEKDDSSEELDEDEEDPDEKDELDEELEQDEDEEKEEDEEEEEGDDDKKVVTGRPTFKQLKTAGVLKQFPAMRSIVAREGEFSKVFSEPADAIDAVDKAAFYDDIERAVVAGAPGTLLKNIKEGAAEHYEKFVDNLLPSLRTLDKEAYLRVATPVIEELLFHASEYATKRGNKNLVNAAKHMADFVFQNGGEIPNIKAVAEKHPAEIELEKERSKAAMNALGGAKNDINTRIERSLVGFLTEKFTSNLSVLEKEAITNKALDELMATIGKDKLHSQKMRNLWRRAEIAGYSEQSKDAIHKAHVARAKSTLAEIRDRLLQDALKGRGRRVAKPGDKAKGEVGEESQQRPRKRDLNSGGRGGHGSSQRRGGVLDPSQIDYKRTSDLDILNDNGGDRVKLRGRR